MQDPPPRSPTETAGDEAFREHHRSFVQILGYKRGQRSAIKKEFFGSGFIIGKKAGAILMLTCDHVLGKKHYQSLRVRLSDTNEDLEATAVYRDFHYDLAVLSVQGNFNALRRAIRLTDGPALAIEVGTLVALVSYYNPPGLHLELGIGSNEELFSVAPGAFGGHITGPAIDNTREGIILPHNCYGIQGSSGGPLICHDTKLAIGVFQLSINQAHMAISTETVRAFLRSWLTDHNIQVGDADTILETISKCERLY